MPRNPFDDAPGGSGGRPLNPFGDEAAEAPAGPDEDPAAVVEHAAARIRRLRSLVGSEGLTLSATRDLIDHLTAALDAVARALRDRS